MGEEVSHVLSVRKQMTELEIPYPPSVNHYYRHVGPRVLISREGRLYREKVVAILAAENVQPLSGKLEMWMSFLPPDNRRRDLDNCVKCAQDALQKGGLYFDDSQIKRLHLEMCEPIEFGRCYVRIQGIGNDSKTAKGRGQTMPDRSRICEDSL